MQLAVGCLCIAVALNVHFLLGNLVECELFEIGLGIFYDKCVTKFLILQV